MALVEAQIRLTASRWKQLGSELIEAAFTGSHRDVERLVSEGANLEAVDHSGYSAISEAAVAGHTPVVGQLLRALADPNHRAQDGRTALHRAAFHGWTTTVQLLLDNGADPAVLDEDSKTPAALAQGIKCKELIEGFPPARTREILEDRRHKLAQKTPPLIEEEVVQEAKLEVCKPIAVTVGGSAANVVKKSATQTRRDRELRYREAPASLAAESSDASSPNNFSVLPPSNSRIEVMGAGEERLNGVYVATFFSRDRVEFEKVDDMCCQVFWCDYHAEWRMLIGDYKMGSVLYRHNHKPNLRADECHGVPQDGWQKWFGKDPVPLVCYLPPVDPCEENFEHFSLTASENGGSAVAADKLVASATMGLLVQEDDAGVTGGVCAPTVARAIERRRAEFLELHPRLLVVAKDHRGDARRVARENAAARNGPAEHFDIRLTIGGERIVETADGLFGANEVVEEVDVPLRSSGGLEYHARAWLREDVGDALPVAESWSSLHAAKAAAADFFKSGRVADARRVTTASIAALRRLEVTLAASPLEIQGRRGIKPEIGNESDSEYLPTEGELRLLLGVLHSNRSLLLLQQIQSSDPSVLRFGVEAAWKLVVDDADEALKADSNNFKASFRRARALFELGELDDAMIDATRVVDHYASSSQTPNPEAAELRELIIESLRKERAKWGERVKPSWNRGLARRLDRNPC